MTVLDASAGLYLVLDVKDRSAGVREVVSGLGDDIAVPHLFDAEIGQVLRRWVLAGELSADRAGRALDALSKLAVIRYPHTPLLRAAMRLRENVTFYDALYVALAAALGHPLLTADHRLAHAPALGVTVHLIP